MRSPSAHFCKRVEDRVRRTHDRASPGGLDVIPVADEARISTLAGELSRALTDRSVKSNSNAYKITADIIKDISSKSFDIHADLLIEACVYFLEIGQSALAISVGKEIALRAEQFCNLPVQRRTLNVVGGQYLDFADFASAMEYLEKAVSIARKLADPVAEAACLANVIAVLQEMGHYRQAISMAIKVLKLKSSSYVARALKLQCASNGLFAAHRIGDVASAARFLSDGESYLSAEMEPLRRAFFERGRVFYLVDLGEVERARAHIVQTMTAIGNDPNARIRTLLTITSSVCDWGLGDKVASRERLMQLHSETKASRLYHHFVLQALIKVHSDAETPVEAVIGLNHARELVEFTTSVKKAKFYRQLASRREEHEQSQGSLISTTTIDPFSAVKDWLSITEVAGPTGDGDGGEHRTLTKHEELTAIHDDMAKLRVKSLRREIRTDAVDTAENWAIAAEFFDDETGQHCYRVGHLASMLAREVGMDPIFCIQVEHAARLHDIGKIAVNEVILLKPGPLDASEMAAMRLHTEVGAQILSGSDDPTLMMAVEVARHHHEWWNGSGYPTRASGKNIPLSARVCAYADVYDALTHARSYKKAWSHERAVEEITRLAGTQFDPDLVGPFRTVLDRYRADLHAKAIPAFADMDSNALIASRKKLMETIASGTPS